MQRLSVISAIIILAIITIVVWWNNGLSSVSPSEKTNTIFVIQKGSGLKEIANNLKRGNLIKDRIVFFIYARMGKFESKIQAGSFRLSKSMNAEEIAQNLTHGTLDIWITIPEGKRATEIAETLKEKMLTYDNSWSYQLNLNEGYLFPDTYLIPKNATIETIINQMRGNFEQKYASLSVTNSQLSQKEIVIVASLIEREAITDAEKPIIAGILMNRLNTGIALQVDATIQYAKGKNSINNKWWEPVTIEEYKSVKSNYNTYLFAGLPPGPISNPGIAAIRAAAFPAQTDYVYYLHDVKGTIRYAKTFNEHNANIAKYGVN